MGTGERIEGYMESVQELFSSLSAEIPNIPSSIGRLWQNINITGTNLPSLPTIPGLGVFEVPPPPPTPPPPPSFLRQVLNWAEDHPWQAAGIVTGAFGSGLLAGYGSVYLRTRRAAGVKAASERRQVVVVLGGDTPHGTPLVLDLERKGYIVLASVATPKAVDPLEQKSQGYVCALVLDPSMPETVPIFLRSLSACLSRRFPISSAGDPYVSPSSHPYIHSVVSLLTLSTSALRGPLEHVPLDSSYVSHIQAAQITPLLVIQSLLPLMRTAPSSGKKSIVFCLPSTETRIGLPFSAIPSMVAAGTLRAAEVLRREIQTAALTGKAEGMKNIKVVIIDVGGFKLGTSGHPTSLQPPEDAITKVMEKWTASEKLTYGPAFAAISHPPPHQNPTLAGTSNGRQRYGVPRKPESMRVFVNNVISVVGNGRFGPTVFGFDLGLGYLRNWVQGERFAIGAGAQTYKYASFLPSFVLDVVLNIPHFLIGLRNALIIPNRPVVRPPPLTSKSQTAPSAKSHQRQLAIENVQSGGESSSNNELSDQGSEADVESNSGDGGAESWVSLKNESEGD